MIFFLSTPEIAGCIDYADFVQSSTPAIVELDYDVVKNQRIAGSGRWGDRIVGGNDEANCCDLGILAGFGGGCMSTDKKDTSVPGNGFGTVTRGQQVPGVVGPNGEPIMAARGATPSGGILQAGGTTAAGNSGSGIQQTALFSSSGSCPDCNTKAYVPGCEPLVSKFYAGANGYHSGAPGYGGPPAGPDNRGIFPVPGMGPPGAVAAVGALPVSGRPGAVVGRTSIRFTGPAGMKVTWQLPNGSFNDETSGLTAPKEYNFLQAQTYRLRLSQILPNFPGKSFYPTLEVAAGNPKSLTYLAHNSVPLTFTNDDFEQARAGNLVVKVIYLPDRENQDFATVAGADELVSTRLEPGADPVAEAQRKGTILAVVRLGNIDLENRISPSMIAAPPTMMVPGPGPTRSGPIMLPAPPQTTPGMGAIPKPIAPLPSIPMPPSTTGSGSSGSGSSTKTGEGGSLLIPPLAKPSTPPAQFERYEFASDSAAHRAKCASDSAAGEVTVR